MTTKVLVTAGATITPIDQVRAITNIFKGRTGTAIALYFAGAGHEVTLMTSNTDLIPEDNGLAKIIKYCTFDELMAAMEEEIRGGKYDVVIHSSAVSDYKVSGVFVRDASGRIVEIDSSGKVSSDHEELFLRLVKTPKIIDYIREPWHFEGGLVKFKLQVGMTDEELLAIALKSMQDSDADMIVANCLEWSKDRAFVVTKRAVEEVQRINLPQTIEKKLMEVMTWESE